MSERDWQPLTSPNWRPLRDAIAFVSRHFRSVRTAETKLYAALVSPDLLSIRERADGVREPLTCWEKINFSVVVSIHSPGELDSDDDITIVLRDDVLGDEELSPYSIFVWWPDVERLCELTAAQPEPAAPAKTPPKQAAKTPRPARSAPKRATAPKRKSVKRRTKQPKRITMKRKLTNAGLARLRDRYPKGISKKESPAVLISQMKPFWPEICRAAGVDPNDYPMPKWDIVARAIGRRPD